MAVKKHGHGTAQSITWGFPSPLVTPQNGEPERSVRGGNPMDEGNMPDVQRESRLIRFGSLNVGSMTVKSSEVVEVLERWRADVQYAVCGRHDGRVEAQR